MIENFDINAAMNMVIGNTILSAVYICPEQNSFIKLCPDDEKGVTLNLDKDIKTYLSDYINNVDLTAAAEFFSSDEIKNNNMVHKRFLSENADERFVECTLLAYENGVLACLYEASYPCTLDVVNGKSDIEALISNASGGVVVFTIADEKVIPLRFSEKFCELVGYSERELFDTVFENGFNYTVHNDDISFIAKAEKRLIETKKRVSGIFRFVTKDKQIVWVEASASYSPQEKGADFFYISFNKADQIKALEARLKEYQNTLMEVLEFSEIDYCEYNLVDGSCKLSDQTAEFFGAPSDLPDFRSVIANTGIVLEEDRHLYLEMLDAVRNGSHFAQCEVRMRKAGDKQYGWIRNKAMTIFDSDKPVRAIGIGIRVDKFHLAMDMFNMAIAQCGINAWLVDIPSNNAVLLNEWQSHNELEDDSSSYTSLEKIFEANGKIFEDDENIYYSMLRKILSGEKVVKQQFRQFSQKFGSYVWYEYCSTVITYEKGHPKVAIISVRDISAEKSVEQSYQEELATRNSVDKSLVVYCRLNVTKGEMEDMFSQYQNNDNCMIEPPVDFYERVNIVFSDITEPREYFDDFTPSELKEKYFQGTHEINRPFWAKFRTSGKPVRINTQCKMVERHDTGEIIAFFYTRDITDDYLTNQMLERLVANSFERVGAVYVKENLLRPVMELNAAYSPWWDNKSYEDGLVAYCNGCVALENREEAIRAMKLDNVVKNLDFVETYKFSYDIILENGELRRKQSEFSYIDKENGVILFTRTDIALYEQLRYLSDHDPLTGLFNRHRMFAETKKMIKHNPQSKYAFVQLDIDRFKLFNSAFGDKEGDLLLQYAATLLMSTSGTYKKCICGRMQSDVFYFCAEYDEETFIQNLTYLNNKLRSYRADYMLKFSFGICIIENSALTLEEASARAAIASKKCKRNINLLYSIYDDDEEKRQRNEMEIINEMHTALNDKQFVVFLQPKYKIDGDEPHGAEALCRWIHPQKGVISPADFIPVFEKNGFIADLDRYMWEEVCKLIRKWIDDGRKPFPVSVNVSRVSLYNPKLVEILVKLVEKYNLEPSYLHLEITESAYMSNQTMMEDIIDALHKAGFIILMDDFGSGYSSLNTLKDFHIDILKIDMKFLPKTKEVKRAEIIISSVIHMAKWLGMDVIMEGVETQSQLKFLSGIGCDYVQGFYYERPIPVKDYEAKYVYSNPQPKVKNEQIIRNSQLEILIVEDDKITREAVSEMLSHYYKVTAFASAEDTLSYLQSSVKRVGLIITDNQLEGMSGLDLLSYCKMDFNLKSIPQILVTAETDPKMHKAAVEKGVDDFILKPVDMSVLVAYADKWMNTNDSKNLDSIAKALDYLNDAAAIFKYHGSMAYLEYANEAAQHLFHVKNKNMRGLSYNQIIDLVVEKEDRGLVRNRLEELRMTGRMQFTYKAHTSDETTNMWIQANGKLIENVDGVTAYITYTDVSLQQRKLEREKRLVECQQILTSRQDFNDSIEQVSKLVQRHYLADRVYIFEFDWQNKQMSNTHEYAAKGITKEIENLKNIPISTIPYWLELFNRGEPVFIDNIEDLADDPTRQYEYEILKPQNVTSLMVLPIIYEHELYGYIGVDNPVKNVKDKDFLINLTYFISQEMHEKKLEQSLIEMSYIDQLTRINNRNSYSQALDRLADGKRANIGIIFADVNGLKKVNDTQGHSKGDKLIKNAAELLVKYCSIHNVYRISGDEFVVIFPEISKDDFREVIEKIFSDSLMTDNQIIAVGCDWREKNDNVISLIREAERKMYKNKSDFHKSQNNSK